MAYKHQSTRNAARLCTALLVGFVLLIGVYGFRSTPMIAGHYEYRRLEGGQSRILIRRAASYAASLNQHQRARPIQARELMIGQRP